MFVRNSNEADRQIGPVQGANDHGALDAALVSGVMRESETGALSTAAVLPCWRRPVGIAR